jgi:hypothetical protein
MLSARGSRKTQASPFAKKVVLRQCSRANIGILAAIGRELDTANADNASEMKKVAEERKLHSMGKVHDFLEM